MTQQQRDDTGVTRAAEDLGASLPTSERVLVPYRLYPSGEIVQVDDSAAKGAQEITYTKAGGQIVPAFRVTEQTEQPQPAKMARYRVRIRREKAGKVTESTMEYGPFTPAMLTNRAGDDSQIPNHIDLLMVVRESILRTSPSDGLITELEIKLHDPEYWIAKQDTTNRPN